MSPLIASSALADFERARSVKENMFWIEDVYRDICNILNNRESLHEENEE